MEKKREEGVWGKIVTERLGFGIAEMFTVQVAISANGWAGDGEGIVGGGERTAHNFATLGRFYPLD